MNSPSDFDQVNRKPRLLGPANGLVPAGAPPVDVQAAEFVEETEDSTLSEYGRMLRRRKGLLFFFALLGGLIGAGLSSQQMPMYQAHTTLEIETFNPNFLDIGDLGATLSGRSGGMDITTQVAVLHSRTLLEQAVDNLQPEQRPVLRHIAAQQPFWREALDLPWTPLPPRDQAFVLAAQGYQVEAVRGSRIVVIYSEMPEPQLAADFANVLAEEFIEQSVEARWKSNQRTAEWLGRQLGDLRSQLQDSEYELQEYARASGLMFTSNQESVAEERLRLLQMELSGAKADRIAKQSAYELATSSTPETLPAIIDHGPIRDYQVKLSDLRRQLADLSATFTAEYPQVKRLKAQIEELETARAQERDNILSRISNEFETALRRETLLETDYTTQAALVSDQSRRAVQYGILQREVETNRQLYDSLLQKVKEASVASAMAASNIRVVDAALPPGGPSKPNYVVNTAASSFLGLMFGAALVLVRARSDRTLKQPGDATSHLKLSELGVIPEWSAAPEARRRGFLSSGRQQSNSLSALSASLAASAPDCVELTTLKQQGSSVAECFRATLTSILFSGGGGDQPRVLAFTSPTPGEGKTTVVSNLAISLAEIQKRVLVIDADLRRPRLHEIFSVSNEWGLSDILSKRSALENGSAMNAEVLRTHVNGLYLVPAGPTKPGLTNLVHSPRMSELLQWAAAEFDVVLIDTPPMLPVPDARVLGKLSDGVVIVLRADKTDREAALSAKQRLIEDGSHVLGAVLNYWNPKAYRYTHHYDWSEYRERMQRPAAVS